MTVPDSRASCRRTTWPTWRTRTSRPTSKVCDLVLVPMASTEQHGPHLPLSTDTVTAYEVASRVAKINNMLHTPAVWTGYSPQHMAGPGEGRGTITIRAVDAAGAACTTSRAA